MGYGPLPIRGNGIELMGSVMLGGAKEGSQGFPLRSNLVIT
jgi:hypothetical protein